MQILRCVIMYISHVCIIDNSKVYNICVYIYNEALLLRKSWSSTHVCLHVHVCLCVCMSKHGVHACITRFVLLLVTAMLQCITSIV